MKFIVVSADDYYMESKDYESIYGLKLYAHYGEDHSDDVYNDETFIYYIEVDSMAMLYEFMNKTERQKIIIQKSLNHYPISDVIDPKILEKEFYGIITIYNDYVE